MAKNTFKWVVSKGSSKKVVTDIPLVVGGEIQQATVRRAVTGVVEQAAAEEIAYGVTRMTGLAEVAAVIFQRLVARTPMDEQYEYIRLFDDDGNLNPHKEVHKPDNDSARMRWALVFSVGNTNITISAKSIDMSMFRTVNDLKGIEFIYRKIIKAIPNNIITLDKNGELNLPIGISFKNDNGHLDKLEMGKFKDSWHQPYQGKWYLHGIVKGFSVQAQAGFYRKTMAELEEAINLVETAKYKTLADAIKKHMIGDVTYRTMLKHYNSLTLGNYASIDQMKKDGVKTGFKDINITKLYEYAMKSKEALNEIAWAEKIPVYDRNRFMDYVGLESTVNAITEFGYNEKDAGNEVLDNWDKIAAHLREGGVSDKDIEILYFKASRENGALVDKRNKALTVIGRSQFKRKTLESATERLISWRKKGRKKYLTKTAKSKLRKLERKEKLLLKKEAEKKNQRNNRKLVKPERHTIQVWEGGSRIRKDKNSWNNRRKARMSGKTRYYVRKLPGSRENGMKYRYSQFTIGKMNGVVYIRKLKKRRK